MGKLSNKTMCISPEQIREIVHKELDDKLDALRLTILENVEESIQLRLAHNTMSPETKTEINAISEVLSAHTKKEEEHWKKIDDILKFQKDSSEAINAVKDLLAGGRVLRGIASVLKWVGGIILAAVAIKVWIIK